MAPLLTTSSALLSVLHERDLSNLLHAKYHKLTFNLSKRSSSNDRFPTVAIVLIAIVGLIVVFGLFKLYSDARSRRETVPDPSAG